jgi:hypothetical protein
MINFIIEFLFGIRIKGESIPPPTFKTIFPEDKLGEFEWINEFRVGIEYGKQKVFFEAG